MRANIDRRAQMNISDVALLGKKARFARGAKLAPSRIGPNPVTRIISPGVLWIQKKDVPYKICATDLILAPVPYEQPLQLKLQGCLKFNL